MRKMIGCFFILLVSFTNSYAQSGQLDPSFGNGGKVIIGAMNDDDPFLSMMAIQPDGKILLVGSSLNFTVNRGFEGFIMRLHANGKIDSSFGRNGAVIMNYISDQDPNLRINVGASDVTVAPDGKIVVVGGISRENNIPRSTGESDMIVLRLNPDGSRDISFDGDGIKIINYVSGYERAIAVSIFSDGGMLVAGRAATENYIGARSHIAVIKLKIDGRQDESFGVRGISSIYLAGDALVSAMTVQQNGKIVLGGHVSQESNVNDFFVVSLMPDGQRNLSFSFDGSVTFDLGAKFEAVRSIAIQRDEKIVVTGDYRMDYNLDSDIPVVRFNKDGTFDASFDMDGKKLIGMPGVEEVGVAVLVDAQDHILIGGTMKTIETGTNDFTVIRLTHTGNPDPEFDGDGVAYVHFGGSDALSAMEFHSGGKIVLAGSSYDREINGAVARIFNIKGKETKIVYTGQLSSQYSDVVQLSATLTDENGQPLSGRHVFFGIGNQGISAITSETGVASTSMTLNLDPSNQYQVRAAFFGDELFSTSESVKPFDVTQEEARATYIGPKILGTPCFGCQTAIIPLRATIQDISAPAPPGSETDPYPGDIRNARAKFVDRDNNVDITGWIPVSKLIDPNDFETATIDATWYVTLSYDQPVKKVRVGIVVDNGYYLRDDSRDDATITLYMPQDDVISGGGKLFVPSTSKGKYKANAGSITSFGFYAQSKPGMPQPSGHMNMWFSGTNHMVKTVTYQLEITSITGLGVKNSEALPKHAEILSIGKLWDRSGSTPVLVEDNVNVHLQLVDIGPSRWDSLTVYIWSNNNVLLHSSNWHYTKATPQELWFGEVTIHSGSSLNESPSALMTKSYIQNEKEKVSPKDLRVTILNNPTRNHFALKVESPHADVYSLQIIDMAGRIVEARNNVPIRNVLQIGSNYKTGMYFAEIRQGKNVRMVKMVKN